jgi:hypothetical protein
MLCGEPRADDMVSLLSAACAVVRGVGRIGGKNMDPDPELQRLWLDLVRELVQRLRDSGRRIGDTRYWQDSLLAAHEGDARSLAQRVWTLAEQAHLIPPDAAVLLGHPHLGQTDRQMLRGLLAPVRRKLEALIVNVDRYALWVEVLTNGHPATYPAEIKRAGASAHRRLPQCCRARVTKKRADDLFWATIAERATTYRFERDFVIAEIPEAAWAARAATMAACGQHGAIDLKQERRWLHREAGRMLVALRRDPGIVGLRAADFAERALARAVARMPLPDPRAAARAELKQQLALTAPFVWLPFLDWDFGRSAADDRGVIRHWEVLLEECFAHEPPPPPALPGGAAVGLVADGKLPTSAATLEALLCSLVQTVLSWVDPDSLPVDQSALEAVLDEDATMAQLGTQPGAPLYALVELARELRRELADPHAPFMTDPVKIVGAYLAEVLALGYSLPAQPLANYMGVRGRLSDKHRALLWLGFLYELFDPTSRPAGLWALYIACCGMDGRPPPLPAALGALCRQLPAGAALPPDHPRALHHWRAGQFTALNGALRQAGLPPVRANDTPRLLGWVIAMQPGKVPEDVYNQYRRAANTLMLRALRRLFNRINEL